MESGTVEVPNLIEDGLAPVVLQGKEPWPRQSTRDQIVHRQRPHLDLPATAQQPTSLG